MGLARPWGAVQHDVLSLKDEAANGIARDQVRACGRRGGRRLLFLILLAAVAVLILRETSQPSGDSRMYTTRLATRLRAVTLKPTVALVHSGIDRYSVLIPLLIGLSVGVLTGMMGVGGGFLNFPILIYIVGIPTPVAVGTSAFQVLFSGAFGGFRHALQGNVELLLVVVMFVGSFAGVQLGVRVVRRLKARRIRRYFALVLAIAMLAILWDLGQTIWS